VVVRRRADGDDEQIGRVHADRTIRMQIEQLGQNGRRWSYGSA
jgi:hypothetical protein